MARELLALDLVLVEDPSLRRITVLTVGALPEVVELLDLAGDEAYVSVRVGTQRKDGIHFGLDVEALWAPCRTGLFIEDPAFVNIRSGIIRDQDYLRPHRR